MVDGAQVITLSRYTLIDPDGVEWTDPELYAYLNAGVRSLCTVKTDAYTKTIDHPLDPGALQSVPEDGIQVFDVTRNVNGDVIQQVSVTSMDNSRPGWMQDNASDTIVHYITDVRNPRKFYVYPPADTGAAVELVYGAFPEDADADYPELPLAGIWQTALWYFVVGSALMKNSKRQDLAKSGQFLQAFNQMIGVKDQKQIKDTPVVNNEGRQ